MRTDLGMVRRILRMYSALSYRFSIPKKTPTTPQCEWCKYKTLKDNYYPFTHWVVITPLQRTTEIVNILKGHKNVTTCVFHCWKYSGGLGGLGQHLSCIKTFGLPVPYPNRFSVLPFLKKKKLCALSLVHKLLNLTTTIKKNFCIASLILSKVREGWRFKCFISI